MFRAVGATCCPVGRGYIIEACPRRTWGMSMSSLVIKWGAVASIADMMDRYQLDCWGSHVPGSAPGSAVVAPACNTGVDAVSLDTAEGAQPVDIGVFLAHGQGWLVPRSSLRRSWTTNLI